MQESHDVAISIKDVSKNFKLPHQKTDSIKSLFVNPLSIFGQKQNVEVQHALKEITFDIKKGEFFGIVGRNGSGKSTLLKILAGIYQPSKGSVSITGKLVPFIELGVGFNPELTGRENVYLSCALNGFSEKETSEMYDDIVDFAELSQYMDQKLKNYSSGMQVRLAFSVATRAKADILLIDEVLAVGDADFQRKCFEYFSQLKKNKMTVVFVSHDMYAIREYCDKVVLVDQSHIVAMGGSEEIAKKYTQLFVEKSSEKTVTGLSEERWGNGKAKYKNVQITHKEQGRDDVVITVEVVAEDDIEDPTYGIMIANASGQPLFGTNTHIDMYRTDSLKKGEVRILSWHLPNVFNSGKYYIEFTLMYSSVTVVADWWKDAASFRIMNEKSTPFVINPQIEFNMKSADRA